MENIKFEYSGKLYKVSQEALIEAYKKAIPLKPLDKRKVGYRYRGKCPVCRRSVMQGLSCSNSDCRQRIDWG